MERSSIFDSYFAKDNEVVSEVQKLHERIDFWSLNLENRSKKLDSHHLSLLLPYLDSIMVLLRRANTFVSDFMVK